MARATSGARLPSQHGEAHHEDFETVLMVQGDEQYLSEDVKDEIFKVRLLIKLADKKIYVSYQTHTYRNTNCLIPTAWTSPRKWRLTWYMNDLDVYNGHPRYMGSYTTLENLRRKVMKLTELS